MTPPTTNLDNLDQLFVQAFQGLHSILSQCDQSDRQRAQQGVQEIRNRESFLDRCKGEKEVRRFLEAGDRIIAGMWQQYTALTTNYTEHLRQHQYVPRTLRDTSDTVWKEVATALQPISRDISTRMQQNHWQGRGADDYMKQLPMQLSAVTEFGQYVEAATTGVDVPGMLQALVFSAGATEIMTASTSINGFRQQSPPSGQYFTKCAYASRTLANVNTWWTKKLMTGDGSWQITLDNHVREMTSSQVKHPVVLKGDKWPRATKDTTDIPRPGSTPIVDRQTAPTVTGAGRAGTKGGVNQGDYQTEDRGGRIW